MFEAASELKMFAIGYLENPSGNYCPALLTAPAIYGFHRSMAGVCVGGGCGLDMPWQLMVLRPQEQPLPPPCCFSARRQTRYSLPPTAAVPCLKLSMTAPKKDFYFATDLALMSKPVASGDVIIGIVSYKC